MQETQVSFWVARGIGTLLSSMLCVEESIPYDQVLCIHLGCNHALFIYHLATL